MRLSRDPPTSQQSGHSPPVYTSDAALSVQLLRTVYGTTVLGLLLAGHLNLFFFFNQ